MLASPIAGDACGDSVALRAGDLLGFEVLVFNVPPDLRFGDADPLRELLDGVVCHTREVRRSMRCKFRFPCAYKLPRPPLWKQSPVQAAYFSPSLRLDLLTKRRNQMRRDASLIYSALLRFDESRHTHPA